MSLTSPNQMILPARPGPIYSTPGSYYLNLSVAGECNSGTVRKAVFTAAAGRSKKGGNLS
jgi:hypothetical protein